MNGLASTDSALAGTPGVTGPRPGLLLCCVLVLVLACYLPVLAAPFLWDDGHLLASPLVQKLHPISAYFSGSFWQHDSVGTVRSYYRPLSILSLALDHRVFGDNPSGFHLTNLSWHLLGVGLLFALLRRQGASGYVAALCSACWGLYPRLTEAAAWVSGRTDVLAGSFVLAALLARAVSGRASRWVTALLLLLGLLCKETALAGLLAVVVIEWRSAPSMAERARGLAPASLALATYAALRLYALGVNQHTLSLPITERVSAIAEALGRYAWMLALPWLPDIQIGRLRERSPVFVALGVLLSGALAVLLWRRRARLTPTEAGHLTLSLSAVALALYAIPFSITALAADRFLYLPLAGAVLCAEPALRGWAVASRRALAALGLVAVSFAGATFCRVQVWADEVDFWTTTLRQHPEAPSLASVSLGSAFSRQGAFEPALQLFRQGSQPGMDSEELGRNNIGTVYLRTGRYADAAQIFQELAAEHPTATIYPTNLALAETYLNRFPEARAALARVLSIAPDDASTLALRGRLPGLEASRRQLEALPSSAPALERARLQASVGLSSEALQTFRDVLSSADATVADAAEATWLALRVGDALTSEAFFGRYQALAAGHLDDPLELAYQSHREALLKLQSVWPMLQ